MSIHSIESESLRLEIDRDNPLRILRLVHTGADRTIAEETKQRFAVRTPERLSDPFFMTEVESVDLRDDGLSMVLLDEDDEFRLTVRIGASANGIEWQADLECPRPTWMLEWRLMDLDIRRVLVPALGGQELGADMPGGTTVSYKYPFWWQSQFAVGETDDRCGVWLRTLETAERLKVLRVQRTDVEDERFTLGLGIEAEAPLTGEPLSGTWYVDGYSDTWREPAVKHRDWIRNAFDLAPYTQHPHFPEWADKINFILEIWGMSKEVPESRHTFDEMVDRIREFAEHHEPTRTLLYLPGFAGKGIDSDAPDYEPATKCGGRPGLRRLVDAAHELGYRVMIHTNVLALAYSHALYERFREYQVIDCFGRPQGWGNDIDGDWLAEPFFAYMNPAYEEWTEHIRSVFEDLLDDFGLDGIFLDQTLLAFNVSRGPNFIRGMREHVRRLQRAFPDVLFAGEGVHEQVVSALPMTQIHGIDSIAGVHGLEGAREWRRVHPISAFVFSPFTRLTAHLLTRHPTSSVFERQEDAYEDLGVMPALVLYNRSQKIDVPQLARLLERARFLDDAREEAIPST